MATGYATPCLPHATPNPSTDPDPDPDPNPDPNTNPNPNPNQVASQQIPAARASRPEQIKEMREAVRPYMLRRLKSDVETLAPLEETVVWVELTRFQKQIYRAALEKRRVVLVGRRC